MKRIEELQEARGRAFEEAKKILDLQKSENRALTDEESAKLDTIHADIDKMRVEIDRLTADEQRTREQSERFEALGRGLGSVAGQRALTDPAITDRALNPTSTEGYARAFRSFLGRGLGAMIAEERATLQIDNDLGGGFVAASERFVGGLLKNADAKVMIRGLATVYTCTYGESLGQIRLDSDLSDFSFGSSELADAVEDTGIALGLRPLKPHPIKRKVIKISRALLESPRLNIESIVQERIAISLARTLEQKYLTGTGALEPLGLFTASADGIPTSQDVSTGNTSSAVKPDNLIEVQHKLRDAYQANARWLFHRDVLKGVRKEKAVTDGQYLWQPGLQAGVPDLILGKPYLTSEYAPKTMTTGLYVGLYGDFSYYAIADAVSMTVQRLLETYALTGQVGLLFDRMAADGMPMLSEAFVRSKLA